MKTSNYFIYAKVPATCTSAAPLTQLGTGHDESSSTSTTLTHTITSFVSLHLIG